MLSLLLAHAALGRGRRCPTKELARCGTASGMPPYTERSLRVSGVHMAIRVHRAALGTAFAAIARLDSDDPRQGLVFLPELTRCAANITHCRLPCSLWHVFNAHLACTILVLFLRLQKAHSSMGQSPWRR